MKKYLLIPLFIAEVLVSYYIWVKSPEYIRQGGPLLVLGLVAFFLVHAPNALCSNCGASGPGGGVLGL